MFTVHFLKFSIVEKKMLDWTQRHCACVSGGDSVTVQWGMVTVYRMGGMVFRGGGLLEGNTLSDLGDNWVLM